MLSMAVLALSRIHTLGDWKMELMENQEKHSTFGKFIDYR